MNHKDEEKKGIVHDSLVEAIEQALLDASPEEMRALVSEMGMDETFESDIAQMRHGLEGVKALGNSRKGNSEIDASLTVAADPLAGHARVRLAFALGSNHELQKELQLSPEGLTWMTDEEVMQLYERLSASKQLR